MIRWAVVGLLVSLGGVASAQTADVIREVVGGLKMQQPPGGQQPGPQAIPRLLQPPPPRSREEADKPRVPFRRIRAFGPTPGGPARFDHHGDRLPAGAVARYGTARLRHGSEPAALMFTPSGTQLVSASARPEGLRVWDVKTGKEVARLDAPLTAVALARDGRILIVSEGRGRVWHPTTNAFRDLPAEALPEGTGDVAVNPDGLSFAAAGTQKITLVEFATGKVLRELKVFSNPTASRVSYSPDGRWLAASGPRVLLWDLRTGKRVRSYPTGENPEACEFAFSPKGDRLAVATDHVRLYALDSEEEVDGFTPPGDPLAAITFSDNGLSLFGQTADGSVLTIDAVTGEVKETWASPEPDRLRPPFALGPDGRLAAACDQSGAISVWNPRTGERPPLSRHPPLHFPGVAADGKAVTFLDAEGRVHSIDLTTGAAGKPTKLAIDADTPAWWDARTRRAAAVPSVEEGEVRLIDADTGKVLAKFAPPLNSGLPTVVFCPTDRDRVAVLCPGAAAVVNAATGQTVRSIELPHADEQHAGNFSPDGRLLAVTAGAVGVWEVATGKKRFDIDTLPNPRGVVFAPTGRLIAVWDNTDTILVFDVRTGSAVRRFQLPGSDGSLSAVAFSPDGKRLATGGEDGGVALWDVATGDAMLVLDRHEGEVTGLAFSPDGSRLVSTATDGTALLWDLTLRPEPKAAAPGLNGADDAFKLLGSADAHAAQRGIEFLYRRPDDTVKWLGERVQVPAAVPADRIAKLVAALGSPEFPAREAAAKELEGIGGQAVPVLRTAVATTPDAERKAAASRLLGVLTAPAGSADELRVVRAVEVVESIGTAAARELLKKWAAGPAGERLTAEAAAALARWK